MSAGSSPNESSAILAEVDAACDRFEAEWRAGARPQIRAYLGRASKPARKRLLQELLRLDIAYRRKCGEQPKAVDYKSVSGLFDAAFLDNLSYLFRAVQNGLVQNYALSMLIGIFLLIVAGRFLLGLY